MERVNLPVQILFQGQFYGPGDGIEIPSESAQSLRERGIIEQATPAKAPQAPADPFAKWPQLKEAGYDSIESVSAASDQALLDLDGIGDASLAKIREIAPLKEEGEA